MSQCVSAPNWVSKRVPRPTMRWRFIVAAPDARPSQPLVTERPALMAPESLKSVV